jgi:protein-tyrosine phosphatase
MSSGSGTSDTRSDRPDFTILVVCTGNLCRSPVAEAYLRKHVSTLRGITVRSAGTGTEEGRPLPQETRVVGARHGLSLKPSSHRIWVSDIAAADLIITMTREHRREVVRMDRRANRRVFTLRELERVIEAVGGARARGGAGDETAWVDELSTMRGTAARPTREADDDVVDPFGRAESVYDQMLSEMLPALDALIAALDEGR